MVPTSIHTTSMTARVETICIGQIRQYGCADAIDPLDRLWATAFFKTPVVGRVSIGVGGITGDAQADRVHHGGPDKALLAYSADHVRAWESELGEAEIPDGGFGENLTCTGFSETYVCIGDRWRVGEVLLEVTQPRQPCWKLGRRWRRPELVKRIVETGRTGWYLRVVETGQLAAPIGIDLVDRPHPDWTIDRANDIFYRGRGNAAAVEELAALPQLSSAWRDELAKHLQRS